MTTDQTTFSGRPSYGYDAPAVMLGLSFGGAASVAAAGAVAVFAPGWWRYSAILMTALGAVPLFFGLLMIIYAFIGKARTREHILNLVH